MTLESVMAEMPERHPFRLAILNVQSALLVGRELLKAGPSTHPLPGDIIKVAEMILEQDAYFSDSMEEEIEAESQKTAAKK